jgi:ferredoxin
MYRRPDGIVDFDKHACIGCKACIAACPYDAIFINPDDHSAEKCNFCAHRLDVGLEPACVVVCPTQAILVGDLDDPRSSVSRIIHREPVAVRRPEKDTRPTVFYRGAHQATLDPLAAARPDGGLFLWSEQRPGPGRVVAGHPRAGTSSAAAMVSFDVPHTVPWDWRVSLYTLTKGISAGSYLIPALLVAFGALDASGYIWRWLGPILALLFLAVTGAILLWDLEHPERFYLLFTRPQRRSWVVRGAWILTGYGALLAAHLAASVADAPRAQALLAVAGLPVAGLTAIYTAYLFAQARARDLWQNPLLPPHLLVQAALAGSAALALAVPSAEALRWVVAASALAQLLLTAGEATLPHATAHARLAAWEMTGGRYRGYFRAGIAFSAVAVAAPWLGSTAAVAALAGILAHDHAYVQAGQAVPLA